MRTIRLSIWVILLTASQQLAAQTGPNNPWKFVPENTLATKSAQRQVVPLAYRTAQLNVPAMKVLLAATPIWQSPAAEEGWVEISLPMPDGAFQRFRVVEAPVMHPDLQAQFPNIRTYAGQGIDDPHAYLRCDFTPKGFHAMVRTPETSTVYIDPYSTADVEHYVVYYRKDFMKNEPWRCDFDVVDQPQKGQKIDLSRMAGDCKLRDYTLALACTGEYAQFHGGTQSSALAAMTTTMARVNGVFEQDASIHMTLHPNTTSLIFLNPSTDPYTNTNGSTMLGQNQTTCDNVIGNANYDIGHVFSTGGGGVAYLGCVCNTSNKAGGVTGQASPVGDPFDIDYVAHEMGHQYGANHTQNNNCNRNGSTAMEPGSASTIMGYAGICAPNVQNNSDDYFHAISLQEMAAEVTSNGSGGGNTCSTNSTINAAPTANAGADYTVPRSTPLLLTGTGSDPDGDPITYTWEQMDNQVVTMPPVSTNTGGPAFRSFKGTPSPNRYLPRLADVVNNVTPTWEVLPSVLRTLNFRLTVRDNHVGGGCTAEDNMIITVNGTAGPFTVSSPNTNVSWAAGSSQTVTWNVASTNLAPVNCANVDILLSVDGGFTYAYTLATATPNDGSQSVTIPSVAANTTSRIMVKANGNIFYDISNVNFTITAPVNGFTVDASPNSQSVCSPTSGVYNVAVGATGGFSGNVTLSVTGLPAGANGSFSVNPVPAPGNSNLTVTTSGVAPGTYNLTVTGTNAGNTQSEVVELTVLAGAPPQVTLSSPANGATGVSQTPTLSWNAATGATSYDVQVSTSSTFTTTVVNATGVTATSYNVTPPLSASTTYYWRVRGVNSCGNGTWATTRTFTTANTTCLTQASTDVPKTISASGTPTVTSTLTLSANGTISDVNLQNLGISHTWINDMIVKLKSPAGTEITLLSQICGSEDNILTNFDDSGSPYSSLPCPPTNNGTYQPFQALSAFNGQNLSGTWTLTVQDMANQDGGSLNSWSLNICYTPGDPPLSVSVNGTNVSCNGGNNGSATANPTGGNGTYSFAWSNGGNTQAINNLSAGSYTVTVTSGSQSATGSVTITQPAALNANVSGTNPTSGNNGSATANPTGGTSPYAYAWNTGGNTQTITGLGAGTYTCTVTDNNDCTATGSVTLTAGGCNTQTINSQGFESGWGIWTDGGTDCARVNSATYASTGIYSIRLRDNTSTSVMSTTNQNLTSYGEIKVEFGFITTGFSSGEDFWLQISTNGGSTYTTVAAFIAGTHFSNNTFYIGTVTIPGPFTSTTRVRFRCDASTDSDNVYIDDVLITGCLNLTGDPGSEARTEVFAEGENSLPPVGNLIAYPNPTNGSLTAEFDQVAENATLLVFDLLGKTALQQQVQRSAAGQQREVLSLDGLVPGTYILQVVDGKEKRYLRFVKVGG